MKRLSLLLALLLAVPLLGFMGMVAQREYVLANLPTVNVAIRGVDPRDLLRGRYLIGDFDWEWLSSNQPDKADHGLLCITPQPGTLPERRKVQFYPASQEPPAGHCTAILEGRFRPGSGNVPAWFSPDGIGGDFENGLRIYVPEARAAELEALLFRSPGAVSIDLAIRPDRRAAIRAVRIGGVPLGR